MSKNAFDSLKGRRLIEVWVEGLKIVVRNNSGVTLSSSGQVQASLTFDVEDSTQNGAQPDLTDTAQSSISD